MRLDTLVELGHCFSISCILHRIQIFNPNCTRLCVCLYDITNTYVRAVMTSCPTVLLH